MDDCTPGDNCGRAGEAEHVREQKTWPDLWIPTREKWSKDSSSLPSGLEESQHDTFAGRLWVVAMCMEIKGGFFFSSFCNPPPPHCFCVWWGQYGCRDWGSFILPCLLPISRQESKVWNSSLFILIYFFFPLWSEHPAQVTLVFLIIQLGIFNCIFKMVSAWCLFFYFIFF